MARFLVFFAMLFSPAALIAQQPASVPRYIVDTEELDNNGRNTWRIVRVRISEPISEEDIRVIGSEIYLKKYPRTTIYFRLPNQTLNQDWGSLNFYWNKEPDVSIHGALAGSIKRLLESRRDVEGEKVGEWRWDFDDSSYVIVLSRHNGRYFKYLFSVAGSRWAPDGCVTRGDLVFIAPGQFKNKIVNGEEQTVGEVLSNGVAWNNTGWKIVINEAGDLDMYGPSGRVTERATRIK